MPCTRSLLKTIESLNHAVDVIRLRETLEARRLVHINFLFNNTMKKCILNIELAKVPTNGNSQ
jgi:hypothetical protein